MHRYRYILDIDIDMDIADIYIREPGVLSRPCQKMLIIFLLSMQWIVLSPVSSAMFWFILLVRGVMVTGDGHRLNIKLSNSTLCLVIQICSIERSKCNHCKMKCSKYIKYIFQKVHKLCERYSAYFWVVFILFQRQLKSYVFIFIHCDHF